MPRRSPAKLDQYAAKRNFRVTPEPSATRRPRAGSRFVVQMHGARRLHYDLRLELDGALKSWALPKGPSLDPDARPLAVLVEDHPVDYADFEGLIPEGEYGAGPVIVWDCGRWEPLNDPHDGLARGDLKFRLHGERLGGSWALVRMRARAGQRDDGRNWLLIKKRDAAATKEDILARETRSVISGRTLEQVRAQEPARQHKPRAVRVVGAAPAKLDPSALRGARRARQPDAPRPQLATAAAHAPEGDRWLHEIKFDGYRLLCVLRDGAPRLLTRTGQDWTKTFPAVAEAAAAFPIPEAVIDGEVVVLDDRGRPDFQALQASLKSRRAAPHVLYAFDLPYAGGCDLRKCTLEDRKSLLQRALESLPKDAAARLRYSEHIRGQGPSVFREAEASGLEGIMSKRADAPYEHRRTATWLKVKATRSADFIVVGYTEPEGSREALGALVLARRDDAGQLVYCGRVGTGFDTKALRGLVQRLSAIECKRAAVEVPQADRKGVHWVEPALVAEVQFGSWTREGLIRHPVYRGLRLDKPPHDVQPEAPRNPPAVVARAPRAGAITLCGVEVTNPDRVVFPGAGITKGQVARYYAAVVDRILPHLVGRPLSLLRAPKGIGEKMFFQRHPLATFPASVGAARVPGHDKRYIVIKDEAGLLALVQFGTIEFHPWGCLAAPPARPDLITFDLDPGAGVPWDGVVAAALAMRDYLGTLKLHPFVKTSGGKGVHIVVPLDGKATWDAAAAFTRAVATRIAGAAPARFTASSTADRTGRIYIDYLRNRSGSTSVAPWSVRARPGAPVSTPLRWDELRKCPGPGAFTVANIEARLARLKKDPWADLEKSRAPLPDPAGLP